MDKVKKYFSNASSLLKQTFKEWREDNVSRLAAGLAYFTIFALPPTVLVILSLFGLFVDSRKIGELLVSQVGNMVGASGAEFLQAVVDVALASDEKNLLMSIIGMVVALVSATGVFIQLKDAINIVWGITEERFKGMVGFVRYRAIAVTGILALGFLLLVSLFLSTGITALLEGLGLTGDVSFLLGLLGNLISLALITLVFALIFKFLPDAEVRWGDVWIGAAATALFFLLGNLAIGIYLGNSDLGETYGIAGSVLVLLTWVYYSAQILLFGAEFTQVYSNSYGTGSIKADEPDAATKTNGKTAVMVAEGEKTQASSETMYFTSMVISEEEREKRRFWQLILVVVTVPILLLRMMRPKRK